MPILRKVIGDVKKAAKTSVLGALGVPTKTPQGSLVSGVKSELAKAYSGSLAETVVNGDLLTRGGMEQVGAEGVQRLVDGKNNTKESKMPTSPFVKAQMNPGLGQPQEQQAPIQSSVMPQKMVAFGDHLSEAFESII